MTTVAILEDIHDAFRQFESTRRLAKRVDLKVFTTPMTPSQRPALLKGVDVVVGLRERTRFDQAFLDAAPDLKLIVQTGRIGPNLEMDAITRRGVLVAAAAGGGAASTVELTIGLIIALLRRIPQSDALLRRGEWVVPYGRTMAGKTLGVIGLGRIGAQVAKLGAAFGMDVLAWSRNNTPERSAAVDAKPVSLEDLLRQSDVVTVHLALNEGTQGLLTAEKLALMKPSTYFVNTSRGAVLDEPALVKMLQERKLAGAGLDVYWQEPLPAGHPLLKLDNAVLTPHVGWPADLGYAAFADATERVINAYLDGTLTSVANPEARRTG